MIDFGPPPKPALILPKPADIIRPGDPRFVVPGMFVATALSGFGAGGSFAVSNSGSFNGSSQYMERTFGTATSTSIWTFSLWVKRSGTGTTQTLMRNNNGTSGWVRFEASNKLSTAISGGTTELITTPTYSSTSVWYHICVNYDSTQGTASNRIKLWVDGTQVTSFDSANYPGSSAALGSINANSAHGLGRTLGGSEYFNGLMAEVYFLDGVTRDPTYFRSSGGSPILYTGGSFGTNGFYLNFSNSGSLGADSSGNGNNWTNTGSVTQSTTVPT